VSYFVTAASYLSPGPTGDGPVPYTSATGNMSVTIPAGYSAGDTLILAAIAGSSSGTAPTAPTSWTAVAPSGIFGVWTKTAVASEPVVSFSLGSGVVLAGVAAVYRGGTVTSSTFSTAAGTAGNVSFTPPVPVSGGPHPTTVLVAANLEYGLSGWQNAEGQGDMSLEIPWISRADPFSTSLLPYTAASGSPLTTYNVALGLSDRQGNYPVPAVTSAQDSSFYAAVLTLSGHPGKRSPIPTYAAL
jgi:hypothetical protein